MAHRGPDDSGEWWSGDGCVALAQRRLAIIDLSPAGHQPMHDSRQRVHLVFNGEIYNYRELRKELAAKGLNFYSSSDTEVVLEAYRHWGSGFLERLEGMFALAIFDEDRNELFLARDRAGEKPLYYMARKGELRFASELKGLLVAPNMPRRINAAAFDSFLSTGYAAGGACLLDGVHKLPPAHALTFVPGADCANVWRYWSMPDAPTRQDVDEGNLLDELEQLLEDSVSRQLVSSDVPVGVLLSGGVDSSLVTAMAARSSKRVRTFTVGFEGFGRYDETEYARLVASHFGTDHLELQAGEVGPEILSKLARQFDEPIVDSSMIPTYLVSLLVRQHCTVVLGGDGGDELFGGYHHHSRLLFTQRAVGWIPSHLRRAIAVAAETMLPVGFKGRNWLQTLAFDLDSELPAVNSLFDSASRRALLGREWQIGAVGLGTADLAKPDDLLQRATRADFANYLAEDILVKVDRATMLASLESRAPFLDRRIVEFAFGRVPSRLKATTTERKILLKRLAGRVLPPTFDSRRKQGFSIPLPAWLRRDDWNHFVRDVLLDTGSLFDRVAVQSLIESHQRGHNNSERLFGLTLFELWRRTYAVDGFASS